MPLAALLRERSTNGHDSSTANPPRHPPRPIPAEGRLGHRLARGLACVPVGQRGRACGPHSTLHCKNIDGGFETSSQRSPGRLKSNPPHSRNPGPGFPGCPGHWTPQQQIARFQPCSRLCAADPLTPMSSALINDPSPNSPLSPPQNKETRIQFIDQSRIMVPKNIRASGQTAKAPLKATDLGSNSRTPAQILRRQILTLLYLQG